MDTSERNLTERQFEVLERVVQRKPYKTIAAELDISETRVKQHVRTIKDRFDANSMQELVEQYRLLSEASPYTKGVGPKSEVPPAGYGGVEAPSDDPGKLEFADAVTMQLQAPWLVSEEPRVVPGVLDGENAGLARLLAILGIVIGLLAAIVLTLTAASVLTDQFDGTRFAPREGNS